MCARARLFNGSNVRVHRHFAVEHIPVALHAVNNETSLCGTNLSFPHSSGS